MQLIVLENVCCYVIFVVACSTTAVNEDHIACDLICVQHILDRGGQHSRVAGRQPQEASHQKIDWSTLARPCRRAALRSGLGCALPSSAFCAKLKSNFFFRSKLKAQPRKVDPRTMCEAASSTRFLLGIQFYSESQIVNIFFHRS